MRSLPFAFARLHWPALIGPVTTPHAPVFLCFLHRQPNSRGPEGIREISVASNSGAEPPTCSILMPC